MRRTLIHILKGDGIAQSNSEIHNTRDLECFTPKKMASKKRKMSKSKISLFRAIYPVQTRHSRPGTSLKEIHENDRIIKK